MGRTTTRTTTNPSTINAMPVRKLFEHWISSRSIGLDSTPKNNSEPHDTTWEKGSVSIVAKATRPKMLYESTRKDAGKKS